MATLHLPYAAQQIVSVKMMIRIGDSIVTAELTCDRFMTPEDESSFVKVDMSSAEEEDGNMIHTSFVLTTLPL